VARYSALAMVKRAISTRVGVVAVAVLATAALALIAVTDAGAVAPRALRARGADVSNVSTDPAGAHVQLTHGGVWVEVRAGNGAGATGGGRASGCGRRWVPTQYPIYLRHGPVSPDYHISPMPPSPGPGYVAYHVFFCGTYVTSVWLPPTAFAAAAPVVDVRAIAERLARDLPYPAATVHASPDGRGLTGLESWFWVSGYRGTIRDAVDGFGIRVEVEATPSVVRWDFGDGTPVVAGSLGQAAPARSDVAHTYEHRSRRAPLTVRATLRLDVRYRVDGGPWQALDPVFRTATRGYPVAESRAALVPAR
jgi:hypothetical protein